MKKYIACILFIICPLFIFAQNKEGLEKKRKDNLKKINAIVDILKKTKKDRASYLDQLKAINRQMFQRRTLLDDLQAELEVLEEEISETNAVIRALERDLNGLLDEYKLMVYHASKNADGFQRLSFLLSSQSFNQFLSRVSYMNQYHEARQNQIIQINKVRALLSEKQEKLAEQKLEKEDLLITEEKQSKELSSLRKQKDVLIRELKKKESTLKKQLLVEQNNFKKLTALIVNNVNESMNSVVEETSETEAPKLNSEASEASRTFKKSKGKLIWPVEEGFVSAKFGRQPHPVFEHLTSENIGIDIRTNPGQDVRTVFEGKVIAVTKVPTMNYLVMVQHGDYFTVYARLKKVEVATGQQVKAEDIIGKVFTNDQNVSELQFQIWKNDNKLNPEKWLVK